MSLWAGLLLAATAGAEPLTPTVQETCLYGPSGSPPLLTAWMFSRRCLACDRAKACISRTARGLGVPVQLEYYPLEDRQNAAWLLTIEEKAGDRDNAVPALVVADRVLGGVSEIEREFAGILLRHRERGAGADDLAARYRELGPAEETARDRLRRWGTGAIVLGGFLDGINPCAFTAIALLLSWLTVLGRSRRELLTIGAVFCATVFGCYFAMGAALSQVLSGVGWLGLAGRIVRWLVIAATLGFAVACAYDTYLAARGRGREMVLRLPQGVEARVRGTIRGYAKGGGLVVSTIGLAAVISILETACTGQLYLPAISYLVGTGGGWYVLGHLALYNAAFIVPLVAVFLGVALGISSQRFAALYRQAMPAVKGAMCAVFLGLTALLVVLEVTWSRGL